MTTAYEYKGNVPDTIIERAKEAFKTYKADKEPLVARIRDNEYFYRSSYEHMSDSLNTHMRCDTPLIFSAIENSRADAIDNYPSANILEREPAGTTVAALLSKIVPAQLEISDFKKAYKENIRNKLKYGTAVYGVFYDMFTGNIDIRTIDILDVFTDMHISDIQESPFLFISAAVENELLSEMYPEYRDLFCGDAQIETLTMSCNLKNRSSVLDCYYKKPDGTVHMMKLCKDVVIAATEDMKGYENGLYSHGMYPVIFDVLYPTEHSPFGFGMMDIGKTTQIEINKLDNAITENVMCGAKPRYLTKRNGGIDEEEFRDLSKNIVHYEGETDAIRAIDNPNLCDQYLSHRERKKDELKELLANRDFQQGATMGGVTAASAIETLQQAGEKRSRAIINDTYDSYKKIIYMMIELMRQFFEEKRVFRINDEFGQKTFAEFENSMMYKNEWGKAGTELKKLMFDIDVIAQRENPYSRESVNNTIMTLWQSGIFTPQNSEQAIIALKNMSFDGKDRLIADLQRYKQAYINNLNAGAEGGNSIG